MASSTSLLNVKLIWLTLFSMLICGSSLVLGAEEQLNIEARQQKDDDLSESIKYLETLDNYIYQNARPRFGRSEYKQPGGRFAASVDQADYLDGNNRAALLELLARNQLARKYHREPLF